jgi:hypothetical protein
MLVGCVAGGAGPLGPLNGTGAFGGTAAPAVPPYHSNDHRTLVLLSGFGIPAGTQSRRPACGGRCNREAATASG